MAVPSRASARAPDPSAGIGTAQEGRSTTALEFIPSTPGELDIDWLTEAMRAAGALDHGAVVTAMELSPLDGAGAAMTGVLARAHLEYDPVDAGPQSVIAKFPTPDRQIRGMLEQFDAYAREIHFYRLLTDRVVCRTPRHLGSALDPGRAREPGRTARVIDALPGRVQLALTRDVTRYMRPTDRRYVLLIEDLGVDPAVYDAVDPPPLGHLRTALDALAGVHAQFWGDRSLGRQPALGHLVTRTPRLYRTEVRRRGLELAQERWADWWGPQQTEIVLEAADHLPGDIEAINRPVTLVHGDPRSDNLLYLAPDSVAVVDWALAGFAHPGWDVSYLLGSSVRPEDVGEIGELLAGYLDRLGANGAELDSSELHAVVDAGLRVQAVQQVLSVRVLQAGYGDGGALHDLWMPRILAALARPRV